jgi:hypothetical protein
MIGLYEISSKCENLDGEEELKEAELDLGLKGDVVDLVNDVNNVIWVGSITMLEENDCNNRKSKRQIHNE